MGCLLEFMKAALKCSSTKQLEARIGGHHGGSGPVKHKINGQGRVNKTDKDTGFGRAHMRGGLR